MGQELPFGVVYRITNTVNGKIYIGQTIDPDTRKESHRKHGKYMPHTNHFYNAVKKHGWEAFRFEEIDTAFSPEELNHMETYWIKWFNATDPEVGYNIAKGGADRSCQESTRRKISESHKRNIRLGLKSHSYSGKRRSDEEKAHMSEIVKIRYKDGFIHPMLGKKQSPEHLAKTRAAGALRSHAIRCVQTGVEYPSIREAERQLDIAVGTISGCLRGVNKTAGSYQWEYVDAASIVRRPYRPRTVEQIKRMSESKKGVPRPKSRKAVVCIETGQMFPSLSDAAQHVESSSSQIFKSISKGRKAGGLHWRYHTEPQLESV